MIVCRLCKKKFKTNLGNHLKRIHGIDSSEYKSLYPGASVGERFGLADPHWVSQNRSLVTEICSLGGKKSGEIYKGEFFKKCEEEGWNFRIVTESELSKVN